MDTSKQSFAMGTSIFSWNGQKSGSKLSYLERCFHLEKGFLSSLSTCGEKRKSTLDATSTSNIPIIPNEGRNKSWKLRLRPHPELSQVGHIPSFPKPWLIHEVSKGEPKEFDGSQRLLGVYEDELGS